jgi:hypothetical protein
MHGDDAKGSSASCIPVVPLYLRSRANGMIYVAVRKERGSSRSSWWCDALADPSFKGGFLTELFLKPGAILMLKNGQCVAHYESVFINIAGRLTVHCSVLPRETQPLKAS